MGVRRRGPGPLGGPSLRRLRLVFSPSGAPRWRWAPPRPEWCAGLASGRSSLAAPGPALVSLRVCGRARRSLGPVAHFAQPLGPGPLPLPGCAPARPARRLGPRPAPAAASPARPRCGLRWLRPCARLSLAPLRFGLGLAPLRAPLRFAPGSPLLLLGLAACAAGRPGGSSRRAPLPRPPLRSGLGSAGSASPSLRCGRGAGFGGVAAPPRAALGRLRSAPAAFFGRRRPGAWLRPRRLRRGRWCVSSAGASVGAAVRVSGSAGAFWGSWWLRGGCCGRFPGFGRVLGFSGRFGRSAGFLGLAWAFRVPGAAPCASCCGFGSPPSSPPPLIPPPGD